MINPRIPLRVRQGACVLSGGFGSSELLAGGAKPSWNVMIPGASPGRIASDGWYGEIRRKVESVVTGTSAKEAHELSQKASSQASGVERARTWMSHYRRNRPHLTRPVSYVELGNPDLFPPWEGVTARRVSEIRIERSEKANARPQWARICPRRAGVSLQDYLINR